MQNKQCICFIYRYGRRHLFARWRCGDGSEKDDVDGDDSVGDDDGNACGDDDGGGDRGVKGAMA